MTQPKETLVIEGGTLIDGTGRPPQRDAVIVIQGDRIHQVGPRGQVSYPPGATVLKAEGKYILPGLIDMHVHYRDWMPQLLLNHGVTSVVDASNDPDWILAQREGIAKGKIPGPRIFAAGPALGGPPALGRVPSHIWTLGDAAETERTLQGLLETRRVDLFKAYTHVTLEQLKTMCQIAREAGIPVLGHLNSVDAREAALAGIRGLAHASGVAMASIPDPQKVEEMRRDNEIGISVDYPYYLMAHAFMDPARTEELVALLVDQGVSIELDLVNITKGATPRAQAYEIQDYHFLNQPALRYLPEDFRLRALSYRIWRDLSPEELELLRQGHRKLQDFVRRFVEKGGQVLAGSDVQAFVIPGISLHRELELLVDAGLTPMQAIMAATRNNARFLGKEAELGTLEPGKRADLLVVSSDPLKDIGATREIQLVIKDGIALELGYHAHFANPLPRNTQDEFAGNPLPFIERLSPGVVVEGAGDTELVLEGSNFIRDSVVSFDHVVVPAAPVPESRRPGMPYLPIYRQLRAVIPAPLLRRPGTFPVTVTNPRPKGGTSNTVYFIVKFA